jgi:hypothetical protein
MSHALPKGVHGLHNWSMDQEPNAFMSHAETDILKQQIAQAELQWGKIEDEAMETKAYVENLQQQFSCDQSLDIEEPHRSKTKSETGLTSREIPAMRFPAAGLDSYGTGSHDATPTRCSEWKAKEWTVAALMEKRRLLAEDAAAKHTNDQDNGMLSQGSALRHDIVAKLDNMLQIDYSEPVDQIEDMRHDLWKVKSENLENQRRMLRTVCAMDQQDDSDESTRCSTPNLSRQTSEV